jgi:hypothetical protein
VIARAARAVVLPLVVASLVAGAAAGSAAVPSSSHPASSLSVAYRYKLTHAVASQYRVPLVTEARSGSVFYVSGTTVYEVTDHHVTTVAAQIGKKVLALAASPTLLAVETRSAVIAYDPATASQVASWPIKETGSFLPDLDVAGGVVWSLTDAATDESGAEPGVVTELRVGEPATTITSDAAAITPVVDLSGDLYFATFAGRLVRETPAGTRTTGTVRKFAFASLAYINGTLLAEVDGTGKPTDYEINPATLAVRSTTRGHTGDYFGLVSTTIGALSLAVDCGPTAYCSKASVRRITLPDRRGSTLSVPWGTAVMGPDATVLEIPHSARPQLVGLQ